MISGLNKLARVNAISKLLKNNLTNRFQDLYGNAKNQESQKQSWRTKEDNWLYKI